MGTQAIIPPPLTLKWKCEQCGYDLGEVTRDADRVTVLNVYNRAWNGDGIPPMVLVAELKAGKVTCTHCGAVRFWRFDEFAMNRMIARIKKRV